MLEALSKNDDKYRSYAFKICGNHELKNDLVNDMYLKVHFLLEKYPGKNITNGMVFLIIRSIFIDGVRKNKEFPIEKIPEIEVDENLLNDRSTINDILSEMSFFDRQMLLKGQEQSFREIGREIDCHHSSVSKMYKNSLSKVKKICQKKGMLPKKAKD